MFIFVRPRIWFLAVALFCVSVLAYALYVQHVEFLDPCPLCVLQRVAFVWIGVFALMAAIHGPGPTGRAFYGALVMLGAAAGAVIAGRHVWLQGLPPDQVPDCGMGLNYMLDTMPFAEVMAQVFYGSGECATIDWTFMGLSMPSWTLICYIGLGVITLGVVVRARKMV
ncbi:disulfide bond formation protein B [Elongatibacter sediminis]|uniref:Disulfide bond formation protein B n=1 Tax=Elongatibacter sediminis TaxID=3119006 RepID=A0AAW9R804_9GAMM